MIAHASPLAAPATRRAEVSARLPLVPLAALTAVGAALRFATLGGQSFDLDESVTVALLHQGLQGMLATIPKTESTPPLYYILAWLWTRLFGLNEVGLRSLSALLGTAMIPLAYATARRLAGRRAALLAAALTALSPWLLWYSQEARSYALFALLSLASVYAFLLVLEEATPLRVSAWTVLCALALASHYFALFLLAPMVLWLLLDARPRGRVLLALALLAAAGAALLPLALEQARDIRSKAGFLQTPLGTRIADVPSRLLLGEAVPSSIKDVALLIALALALVAAFALLRPGGTRPSRPLWIVLSLAAFALLFPVLLALAGHDYLDARNLVGAFAPLVILAAAAYARAGRSGMLAGAALAILFALLSLLSLTDPSVARTDYRGIAAALGPSPGPGQRAIVVSPDFNWTPLAYYLPHYPQLSGGSVGVREIDLIGWSSAQLSGDARRTLARSGFHYTASRSALRLQLLRFSSPTVRSVTATALLESRLGTGSATVLIQSRR